MLPGLIPTWPQPAAINISCELGLLGRIPPRPEFTTAAAAANTAAALPAGGAEEMSGGEAGVPGGGPPRPPRPPRPPSPGTFAPPNIIKAGTALAPAGVTTTIWMSTGSPA